MPFFDDLKNSPTGMSRQLTGEERFLKEKDRIVKNMVIDVKGQCTEAHKKGIRALNGYFEFYINEGIYGAGLVPCSYLDKRIEALHNGEGCRMWELKRMGMEKLCTMQTPFARN